GPIFNTYEFGGYLIWRLWPQQQVFIDGRALSESVFNDYGRILYNHDDSGGPSAQQLLNRYNVQTIVMNTMEYTQGLVYLLAPAHVLGLACAGVFMGNWLKRRLPFLDRLNIPAPVAGGMVYAVIALALHDRWLNIEADTVLRDLLMIAFMTTVGLGARMKLIV